MRSQAVHAREDGASSMRSLAAHRKTICMTNCAEPTQRTNCLVDSPETAWTKAEGSDNLGIGDLLTASSTCTIRMQLGVDGLVRAGVQH